VDDFGCNEDHPLDEVEGLPLRHLRMALKNAIGRPLPGEFLKLGFLLLTQQLVNTER
jgi:hypothetical protein